MRSKPATTGPECQKAAHSLSAPPGLAETCKHIIAFADEKHAKPCPVCELEQVKIKLCHLHGNVTDIKVFLRGIIEDAKVALERCDVLTTRIREIQEAHGHLRPPNKESEPDDSAERKK